MNRVNNFECNAGYLFADSHSLAVVMLPLLT